MYAYCVLLFLKKKKSQFCFQNPKFYKDTHIKYIFLVSKTVILTQILRPSHVNMSMGWQALFLATLEELWEGYFNGNSL